MNVSYRQIRAACTEESITLYQAYDAAIAGPAVAAQRFVAPFKRERMTWIKPSFLWMMYRCGYATKPGQGRVLAIELSREGFEWALGHSCLSHDDGRPGWAERVRRSPVRIQWDPERGLRHEALPHRSIQIGLSGDAVRRYVDEWTLAITDITDRARAVHAAVGRGADVTALLPAERPYPLPDGIIETIGASRA
ncbi:DUF4291 domain-containing protein [Nonomuraea basaltis]|uniref:DUF4291 domain-containing protein n=1 Tax=Nonomuraea basaltis TaxID=2495887 RepID=UPI00110C4ADE|nr:DUF4291 domain-containing protein [Nonomuraea basaltis]TMR89173.1 DUF4291 domain-containing protein [Nonomuraea basaltis]